MRIISFSGPKGSGKDTCADILYEAGISRGKISLAGPLKAMMSKVYGIDPKYFEDRDLKEKEWHTGVDVGYYELLKIFDEMRAYLPLDDTSQVRKTHRRIKTPRGLLQYVGTDIIRKQIDPEWHLKAAFSPKNLQDKDLEGLYCVTDARFPNEYEWLSRRFMLDFTGFYVERTEAEVRLATATHESELVSREVRKLIPDDFVLVNDGSIKCLADQLLHKIKR